ncbi:MAG: Uma2 family endonuclease [Gemmataceae bacterium]|nr:Uma2 family endonuclease [Gemmataceae bacterium]
MNQTEIIEIVEKIEVPVGFLHPNLDLPETNGEPLESPWHRDAINLLIGIVKWLWHGRTDFFVGGNMFIYFSTRQEKTREFRGPDFFLVKDVDGTRERRFWHLIVENGRYPDLIIELLSPTTAEVDRTTKKRLYENTFRTREYFCYDPATRALEGWRLERNYQPIPTNERGWMWSEEVGLWLGTWEGVYEGTAATWLRFFDLQGQVVLSRAESAEGKNSQLEADNAHLRAENAKLKAFLAEKGLDAPP